MQNNITGYAIGELIENRYRVMAIIGQGGMGEVYRVADIGRGYKEIALKLIRKELLGIPAKFLARIMQQEFRLLTQLWHPNLIEVYDYGITESGGIYYSMAYVDGPNLGEKMPSMRLEMLVQALVQICRALAYLHVRGVIHGDLKPANALLEGESSPRKTVVGYWLLVVGLLTALRAGQFKNGKEVAYVKMMAAIDIAVSNRRQPQPTTGNQKPATKKGRMP